MPETTYRICPLCEATCGLEIQHDVDRVLAIRGAEHDVFSGGYLCPKAVALKDLHEDPDRLRTPLVRRDGRLVEATWDEAFAEIERRLVPLQRQHGRDAVALMVGNPAVHKMSLILYVAQLAKALGSRNVFSASTLDQMPKQLSSGLMFGHWLSIPVPDIDHCDWLLVLGANPMVSNGSLWTVPNFPARARALRERGGKLLVVDPRFTETAAIADAHLAIRPGTDVFLLAAMAWTLFDEGLVRLGRLESHVLGLGALRDAVAPFEPEMVSARCGLSPSTIRELARALASTERAAVYGRLGTCTQRHGTLVSWLVDALNILTGHLDEPGGAMFPKAAAFAANTRGEPGRGEGITTGRWTSRVSRAPEVFGELPATCLAEEIETPGPGQVRALITVASNPALSVPDAPRLQAALDSLDFMVSVDLYLNETTRHADVILPGRSPLEDSHYDVAFPQLSCRNQVRYSPPVFSSEAPPEWQLLLRLGAIAQGMGTQLDAAVLDDLFAAAEVRRQVPERADQVLPLVSRYRGPERLLELALRLGPYGDRFGEEPDGLTLAKVIDADGGLDLGALAPRVPELLRTPSGRIELAPERLCDALELARAELFEPVPHGFVVVGRRDLRSNNSWMHNLPTLAKGPLRCTVLMHPLDAERVGVTHGAKVRLSRGSRSIVAEVELSAEMVRGVVSLPHGWGHDLPGTRLRVAAERPGVNLNAVIDDGVRDPLSGNAVLSGVAVTIDPA